MEKQLLTARDVADALGHKETGHVYALIRAGEIPAVKVGSRGVRIPRQALDAYLASLPAAAHEARPGTRSLLAACASQGAEPGPVGTGITLPASLQEALSALLAPSPDTLARMKHAADGMALYLQNSAPRR